VPGRPLRRADPARFAAPLWSAAAGARTSRSATTQRRQWYVGRRDRPGATVNLTKADPASDALTINGHDGDDILDAAELAADSTVLTMDGGAADDLLVGGDGDSSLFGRGGDDILVGGPGRDVLDGGTGPDVIEQDRQPHRGSPVQDRGLHRRLIERGARHRHEASLNPTSGAAVARPSPGSRRLT
jgi:hypothetical protein